ncbi:lipopolysaccharide biosynthesis protein [Changpingibacter yushuensis]|uniref:lipopolysaccharide biosynthesis protein n=1 Tax=Changpingibacter yushuensis TaxID=2758440 RepID=UPI0015F3B492|nr:lipopolysaccharide biosynthesis protein [Changpingibacter yushuensis]
MSLQLSSQRKVGAVLGYTNILVKNLVYLIYTPMLLSFVGQADYGVYQTSYSFVFSLSLLTFGFSEAYVRFYTQRHIHGSEDEIRRLNGMYLLLYIAVCAIALVLGLLLAANASSIFSGSFTDDEVNLAQKLIVVMTFNITMTLLSTVFDAFILAHEQFKFQQSRQMLTTLATPGLAYGLLNLGMGAVGAAVAQLAVTFVLLILNARFAIGKLGMRFDVRHFDSVLFRSVAAFSAWIFTNQVCELINQNVPNVLLGALTSASTVAVFAVSVQIRSVFYSLSTTMSSIFTPKINRMVAESDDNAELTDLMARVGRYQATLFVYVFGGFILLGRFFVERWAGPDFLDGYYLVLVMVAPLFVPLVQNTGIEIQRAKNRHRARSIAYLLMAILNVTLTALLVPILGFWAPAIGYVAYIVFGSGLFMNWYYQKRIGLDMVRFWKRIVPIAFVGALVCAVCVVGSFAIPAETWNLFITWGLVYSLLYTVAVYIIVLDQQERASLSTKLRRWRRHHD